MIKDLSSIDQYISEADEKAKEMLRSLRQIISEAAPGTKKPLDY